jgi:sterol desaturase/sphingolipid hydroxylase (fatty acid hydroxylase superfamily)
VHHARGIHNYNFADLPVFDILFGTFRNPRSFEHETGFYDGASDKIGDMLLFRDLNNTVENVPDTPKKGIAF